MRTVMGRTERTIEANKNVLQVPSGSFVLESVLMRKVSVIPLETKDKRELYEPTLPKIERFYAR